MKPDLELVPNEGTSIFCYQLEQPCFDFIWHYHPEYELTYVIQGRGTRLVGDCVETFAEGDLIFIGSDVPHTWVSEPAEEPVKYIGIQFSKTLFSESALQKTEFFHIASLFNRSNRSFSFDRSLADSLADTLSEIYEKTGMERYLLFIRLLDQLGKSDSSQYRFLTSETYKIQRNEYMDNRFDIACKFIHNNFQRDLQISELAEKTSLTVSSFCRFFKRMTGKTFTTYLNELRISFACELLVDRDALISSIAYKSGFNSLTHFNRVFLKIKGFSPRQYRQQFRINV